MKRQLKMIGFILGGSLLLMVVIVAVFVNVSQQMGGKHSQEDKIRYQESGHYVDGKFMNLVETTMDFTFSSSIDLMKAYIKGNPKSKPDHDLPVLDADSTEIAKNSAERLIWFGHSAFLLHMDGKNILIDPMLGQHPSPSTLVGTKRFTKKLPIEVEELPEIDAVLISHDHYDHLDYGSIQALKDKTKDFYVPLGVGAHLRA
ncbi:MAG: MBL fold metallo-hydrolase, partial [Schleiferiaceae bacterium]